MTRFRLDSITKYIKHKFYNTSNQNSNSFQIQIIFTVKKHPRRYYANAKLKVNGNGKIFQGVVPGFLILSFALYCLISVLVKHVLCKEKKKAQTGLGVALLKKFCLFREDLDIQCIRLQIPPYRTSASFFVAKCFFIQSKSCSSTWLQREQWQN